MSIKNKSITTVKPSEVIVRCLVKKHRDSGSFSLTRSAIGDQYPIRYWILRGNTSDIERGRAVKRSEGGIRSSNFGDEAVQQLELPRFPFRKHEKVFQRSYITHPHNKTKRVSIQDMYRLESSLLLIPHNRIDHRPSSPLLHVNCNSSSPQTPSCKTVYTGATPPKNGICSVATGSSNDAVTCPFALTSWVSASITIPFAPDLKVAVWFVSGMVTTICPDRKTTYLIIRLGSILSLCCS